MAHLYHEDTLVAMDIEGWNTDEGLLYISNLPGTTDIINLED